MRDSRSNFCPDTFRKNCPPSRPLRKFRSSEPEWRFNLKLRPAMVCRFSMPGTSTRKRILIQSSMPFLEFFGNTFTLSILPAKFPSGRSNVISFATYMSIIRLPFVMAEDLFPQPFIPHLGKFTYAGSCSCSRSLGTGGNRDVSPKYERTIAVVSYDNLHFVFTGLPGETAMSLQSMSVQSLWFLTTIFILFSPGCQGKPRCLSKV